MNSNPITTANNLITMELLKLENIRQCFVLFWLVASTGILLTGLFTLCGVKFNSRLLPGFVRTLVLFGKYKLLQEEDGESSKSNKSKSKPNSGNLLFGMIETLVKKLEIKKSYFRHFYLLSLAVNYFVMFGMTYILSNIDKNRQLQQILPRLFGLKRIDFRTVISIPNVALLIAQLIQSIRRFYESNYISIYSGSTINLVHYLTGFAFYISLGYASYATILGNSSFNCGLIRTLIIFALFLGASYIQYCSHVILAKLRTDKTLKNEDPGQDQESKVPDKELYLIPRGGLFDYISCPHYLSEIVIYYCLLEFSGFDPLWQSIFVFVLSNQLISALLARQWYRRKFGERYPNKIKALIPFIF